MRHAPITVAALRKSVIELVDQPAHLGGFDEGYQAWLSFYREDDAGVFSISVAEIIDGVEQTLAR